MKKVLISEIVNEIHKVANPKLAYEWDNVGFLVGDINHEAKKVLLTLDITEGAINKAVDEDIDLIISHHPLIFRPIKRVTDKRLLKLIKNNIGVLCAHTNLDVVKKGVNFALADRLNLRNSEFLSSKTGASQYLIKATLNNEYFEEFSRVLPGINLKITNKTDEETEIECVLDSFLLQSVISLLNKFAKPSFYISQLQNGNSEYGLGLIANLPQQMSLAELAKFVKTKLNAPIVKLWTAGKSEDYKISKVAICGGSGSSLLREITGRAEVLISADFTYHTILDSKIPLIDAGHFYTENPVLDNLEAVLQQFPVEIVHFKAEEHEINNLRLI